MEHEIRYISSRYGCHPCLTKNLQVAEVKNKLLCKKEGNFMKKLTSTLKRVFSKDLQVQYKAGFIDNTGELTDKGLNALHDILIEANNKRLTELAQESLDEETKR